MARSGNRRRVLITGAAGFIGRHLSASLSRKYEVAALDRRPAPTPLRGVEHYVCDLLDSDSLSRCVKDAQPEAVLHLAARTDLDGKRIGDYAANIEGVENLVAAIRGAGTVQRAVCTSTQLVCRIGYTPTHDQDYRPSTLYGESKVRTEQVWRTHNGGNTNWCLVRPTTIWGPHMNPHYLRFFEMIRAGRYVHIGGAPRRKSYGYVGNTVVQYQRLLEAPSTRVHSRTFYLADYEPLILEEWAERFRVAFGAPAIRTIPMAVAVTAARIGDLVSRVGWRNFPFTSFRLTNVLTSYTVDLTATREVCGEIPYSVADGVAATAVWLQGIWQDRSASTGTPKREVS